MSKGFAVQEAAPLIPISIADKTRGVLGDDSAMDQRGCCREDNRREAPPTKRLAVASNTKPIESKPTGNITGEGIRRGGVRYHSFESPIVRRRSLAVVPRDPSTTSFVPFVLFFLFALIILHLVMAFPRVK
jgi:hypothetical protein